jgi:hypothetical protein
MMTKYVNANWREWLSKWITYLHTIIHPQSYLRKKKNTLNDSPISSALYPVPWSVLF